MVGLFFLPNEREREVYFLGPRSSSPWKVSNVLG